MSEFERNKKQLIPVTEDIEVIAENAITEKSKWFETKIKQFTDDPIEYGYVFINEVIYRVVDLPVEDHEPEYCNISKNEDGSFTFESYHYNGGAHWYELLEGKLK